MSIEVESPANGRTRFQADVAALVTQFRIWAEGDDWVTKEYPKRMRDVDREVYVVPSLVLQKGPTRLLLDPIAYDVPGSRAFVDLYLMPIYDDAANLALTPAGWTIAYDRSVPSVIPVTPRPLDEQTAVEVLDSILAHAIPSA